MAPAWTRSWWISVETARWCSPSPPTPRPTPRARRPFPHIRRERPLAQDGERYQTVFARAPGSVAAPTAGLHLSQSLLDRLCRAGVERAEVVLHIGPGTFRPLRPEDLARGRLHAEPFDLPTATAEQIARTRARGGRVVAVGTTAARVLESCAESDGGVRPGRGETAEEPLLRLETIERVRRAIQELSAPQQQIVRMRIHEEKTFAAIARELGIPLGTALARMRAALARLREKLQ